MDNLSLFKRFCKNSLKANDVDPSLSYMRYIINRMEFNEEQVLWFCFLYAVTYNLPSAYLIWSEYPDLELVGLSKLTNWWENNQRQIPFQTDKIKQRRNFVDTVKSYKELARLGQKSYFDNLLNSDDPQENFYSLWTPLNSIAYFGRFSIWNWCQALKHVAGYNIEPMELMIGEPESVSFTDGLALAYGLHDKVTKKESGVKITYRWSEIEKAEMEHRCAPLKEELGMDNFQLETLSCAFKKIWRDKDSRYVGYYNDRIADDIRKTSAHWKGVDWQLLWDARQECVPPPYLNDNKGVSKSKFLLPPQEKVKGAKTK